MSDERARIQREYLAALEAGEGVIDVGDNVICDGCNEDMTNDPRSGGFLFGSYGYGPCCGDKRLESIRGYGEESYIRAHCPEGMSYADWIRRLRGPHTQIRVERGRSAGDIGRQSHG